MLHFKSSGNGIYVEDLKSTGPSGNAKSEMQNLKSEIWNVKSQIQNLKYKIQTAKSKIQNLNLVGFAVALTYFFVNFRMKFSMTLNLAVGVVLCSIWMNNLREVHQLPRSF